MRSGQFFLLVLIHASFTHARTAVTRQLSSSLDTSVTPLAHHVTSPPRQRRMVPLEIEPSSPSSLTLTPVELACLKARCQAELCDLEETLEESLRRHMTYRQLLKQISTAFGANHHVMGHIGERIEGSQLGHCKESIQTYLDRLKTSINKLPDGNTDRRAMSKEFEKFERLERWSDEDVQSWMHKVEVDQKRNVLKACCCFTGIGCGAIALCGLWMSIV